MKGRNTMITKQEIKRSLELMGIVSGDTLLLHSAMTAIGGVEGGADTVIDACFSFWWRQQNSESCFAAKFI